MCIPGAPEAPRNTSSIRRVLRLTWVSILSRSLVAPLFALLRELARGSVRAGIAGKHAHSVACSRRLV